MKVTDLSTRAALEDVLGYANDSIKNPYERHGEILEFFKNLYSSYEKSLIENGRLKDISKRFNDIEQFVLKFYSRNSEEYKEIIEKYELVGKKDKTKAIKKILREKQEEVKNNGIGKDIEKLRRLYNIMKERKALYALRVLKDKISGTEVLFNNMKESVFRDYGDYLTNPENQKELTFDGRYRVINRKEKISLNDFLNQKGLLGKDYRRLRRIVSESGFNIPLRNGKVREAGFSYSNLASDAKEFILGLYKKTGLTKKGFVRLYGLSSVYTLNKILKDYEEPQEQLINEEISEGVSETPKEDLSIKENIEQNITPFVRQEEVSETHKEDMEQNIVPFIRQEEIVKN